MQELPFSIQDFSNIREFNYLYIDKTKYAHDLVIQRGQSFFLSRPRRFGKSVFVSTLKAILLSKKELFEGLWIAKSTYTWPIYGVIHLDFSSLKSTNATTLETSLCTHLKLIAKHYEIPDKLSVVDPNAALCTLVNALYEKFGRVAVLIDEYDHPILSSLHSPNSLEVLKGIQSFFATVKSLGAPIHFLFLTGVTAFAKAGVFSGLSHPKNLSDLPEYACICGYTEEEIDSYFTPYIEKMATKINISTTQLRADLKKMYNGYLFAENSPAVYNPVSLTNALDTGKIKNYWFDSGTPSFLIEILKKEYANQSLSIFQMEEFKSSEIEPKYFDIDAIPIPAIMLQTGYLTIKDFVDGKYILGFPNLEVQAALQRYMMGVLLPLDLNMISNFSTDLIKALTSEDIPTITSLFNTLCSHIPSILHISKEEFYHALLITTFQACGVKTLAEHATTDGFIDLVLELSKMYYIVEVKFNESTKTALEQINQKEYYQPFLHSGKKIRLLGINFHRTTQKQAGKKDHFNVTIESKLYDSHS
ncbi:MAG: AAA family ATPase [Verrucomicrobia bacterium]|nr:AAA family ATPase [Verrucomicrobiota bacterium]